MRFPPIRRVLAFALLLVAWPASSQEIFAPVQELDFEDPEAWAMTFFTSATLQTGLGTVPERRRGEVTLGLELLTIPHLDTEQRTVGFGGFKEEDLNRSPVWARLRAEFGLGGGWGAVLGWAPPVELDGIKASLVSLAIEKSIMRRGPWTVGLRLYGQIGSAEGDLTCTEGGDELFPPGSAMNPFGCEAPSEDEIEMHYMGAELVAGYRPEGSRWTLHGGVSANHLDMELQVDARTFGFIDRSLLLADGDTVGLTLGVTRQTGSRGELGAEVFYSPLDVVRFGVGESDDLLHLRLIWRWKALG